MNGAGDALIWASAGLQPTELHHGSLTAIGQVWADQPLQSGGGWKLQMVSVSMATWPASHRSGRTPRLPISAGSPGGDGGWDEHAGSSPGVWPAPGHGAQDAGLLGAPRIPTPGATRRPRLEPFTGVIDAYSRHNERDRRFRDVVLRAYRSRCALCELDVQVDGRQIGIEAAHIKWHSEGGPPRVENGMVLCVLHHKFFDSGLSIGVP